LTLPITQIIPFIYIGRQNRKKVVSLIILNDPWRFLFLDQSSQFQAITHNHDHKSTLFSTLNQYKAQILPPDRIFDTDPCAQFKEDIDFPPIILDHINYTYLIEGRFLEWSSLSISKKLFLFNM